MKKDGFDAKGYTDFRELLDNPNINAVTIAVPDHWHALIAIEAMRKRQGRLLREAADADHRRGQGGGQGRQGNRPRLPDRQPAALRRTACSAWPASWCATAASARSSRSRRASAATRPATRFPKVAVPEGLNWDFWLGPAPEADYVERKDDGKMVNCRTPYEFRWWYEYSGGKMTDWGAHHNDIAQWGLGMDGSGPVAVEAEGDGAVEGPQRLQHPPDLQDHLHLRQRRQADLREHAAGRLGRPQGATGHDNGVLFVGEDGKWIFVNRGTIEASDKKLIDEPLPADAIRLYDSNDHMGNFLDARPQGRPEAVHLPGGGRPPLGDRLPHRRHRPAQRQEAEVGPGQGAVRRRRGQQDGSAGRCGRRGSWRCDKNAPQTQRAQGRTRGTCKAIRGGFDDSAFVFLVFSVTLWCLMTRSAATSGPP